MPFDGREFRGPGGVNSAECLRVADEIEKSANFNMAIVRHGCGTAACIAGHMMTEGEARWSTTRTFGRNWSERAFNRIRRTLGLSREDAEALFMPSGFAHVTYTAKHGAAVLRHLAATGEVDWIGTKPAPGLERGE